VTLIKNPMDKASSYLDSNWKPSRWGSELLRQQH